MAAGIGCASPNGAVLHHRVVPHGQGAGAPRRIHPRQPPHPALPDDHRERLDHRPAAELGRAAAASGSTTWRSSGPTRTTRSPSSSGTRTASGATSASRRTTTSRRPARMRRSGWISARRASGVMVRAARTSRRTRARSTAAPPASASIVRPTRLDPKTSSMICAQCHSLRDVIAPGYTAGADYYDYFQPVLEYGPRKAQDPAYWPDGRPRRFSNDAIGLWQSECFLRGGATCTSCHSDTHVPDVDRNAQLAPSNNALCTRCHQDIAATADGAHTPSRRQRRQLVRRMPHAEDRDEHQGDDARSHDEPAGSGEHRRVRHPQRLHQNATPTRRPHGRSRRVENGGRKAAA